MKFFPKSLYFTRKRSSKGSKDIPYPVVVTKVTDDFIEYVEVPAEEEWIPEFRESRYVPVTTDLQSIKQPVRVKRTGDKNGGPNDRFVWDALVVPSHDALDMREYHVYFPNGNELFRALIYNTKDEEHGANGKARIRDLFKIRKESAESKLKSIVREELRLVLAEKRERIYAVHSGDVVDSIYDVQGPGGKRQVEILFRTGDKITIRGRDLEFV